MNNLLKFLNNITTRIFNKHTPKGVSAVLIALTLQYLGASDDLIEVALKYNWTFIADILSIIHEYRYYIYVLSIILIMLGGFYVFRRNYYTIKLNSLELDLKHVSIEYEKKKLEYEIKKLDNEILKVQNDNVVINHKYTTNLKELKKYHNN